MAQAAEGKADWASQACLLQLSLCCHKRSLSCLAPVLRVKPAGGEAQCRHHSELPRVSSLHMPADEQRKVRRARVDQHAAQPLVVLHERRLLRESAGATRAVRTLPAHHTYLHLGDALHNGGCLRDLDSDKVVRPLRLGPAAHSPT